MVGSLERDADNPWSRLQSGSDPTKEAMTGQRFSSITERTSLLADVDHVEDSNLQRASQTRRVSTIADPDGNRQSFVVHKAIAELNPKRPSIAAKLNLWIEVNGFLLFCMAASTGMLSLMRIRGVNPLGLSYPIVASPLVFGVVKLSVDIVEPILFRLISWTSFLLNWHIVAFITSFSDNLHRIILSGTMYSWFWIHDRDPWLALFLEACTISCILWACKDVCLRFARRLIIVSSIMKSIRKADRERDALILLCCPDKQTRVSEKERWNDDPYRSSLSAKLEVIEQGALDLPLQPIGDSEVAIWRYSNEDYVRITSLHQMRVIAGVLRDYLFEGGRRPTISYAYWCSIFGEVEAGEKTWESLFSPVSDNLTSKDFVWGLYQSFERRKRLTSQYMNLSNLFALVETACNAIYVFLVVAIFGACFGANISQMTVTLSTSFVALSFALSGTITRVFESLVFIFVRKPFEIGDRITLNGEDFFVKKINLMSTVLRKKDNRVVQYSNTSLSDAAIFNHRRSGPAMIDMRFMVSYETTTSQLQQLKRALAKYVKDNSDVWRGDLEFLVENLDQDTAVLMTVRCHHRLSWQEKGALDEHRYDLAECLRSTMNKLKIETSGSDSIHVRQLPSLAA